MITARYAPRVQTEVLSPIHVSARGEVLLQEVRCDVESVATVGRAFELPAADDLDTVLAHQAPHLMLADAKAQLVWHFDHTGPAVYAKAGMEPTF